MINTRGHIVHIDFGFVFGLAPGKAFSMETAPWKLTPELVDVMIMHSATMIILDDEKLICGSCSPLCFSGDGWKRFSRLPEVHQAVHGGINHRSEVPQASQVSDGDHELQEPLPILRLQLPRHRGL